MIAQPIPALHARLPAARAVVSAPDLHSAAEIAEACEVMVSVGDWIDVGRAHELLHALKRESAAPAARRLTRKRLALALVALGVTGALLAIPFLFIA